MNDIVVSFTENAEEELVRFSKELDLSKLLNLVYLQKEIPEDLQYLISNLVTTMDDMFSLGLPTLEEDPQQTLVRASRDINLAKILRERGLVRLYLVVKSKAKMEIPVGEFGEMQEVEVKTFQTMQDEEGNQFTTQEKFLGWFCAAAHVSRALTFQRFAAYDRLKKVGFTLEEAHTLIMTKPSVITRTIDKLVDWGPGGEVNDINPEVARSLAKTSLAGEEQKELLALVDKVIEYEDPEDIIDMVDKTLPAIRNIIEEVAAHDSARDATFMIDNDILNAPEIKYAWDHQLGGLVIEMIIKGVDENGAEHIADIYKTIMLPDSMEELPREILDDLVRRVPIRSHLGLDQ